MGFFGGPKRLHVSGWDFQLQNELGQIGMKNVWSASDGGVIVKNVDFERCRFSADVEAKVTFIDCTFKNCEHGLSFWDF